MLHGRRNKHMHVSQLPFLHISSVIPRIQRESDIGNSTIATWRLKQTHASITTGIFTRVRNGDHACPNATFSAFERKCDSLLHRCYRGAETNTCKYHNWQFPKRWDRQPCVPPHTCTHVEFRGSATRPTSRLCLDDQQVTVTHIDHTIMHAVQCVPKLFQQDD